MAKDLKRFDLLISCPGDANYAVGIVEDVVEEFNQLYSDALSIIIRSRHWSKSAYSESGGKPQDLLNKQIVNDADLAVAIFKNRFGTPTENYGSGTEEEIERMLADGKQVFLFFDDTPAKVSEVNYDEYNRVQNFKKRYKDKGIYWTYSSEDEFKNIFRAHITQYFMSLSIDNVNEGKPNIILRSYENGNIIDDFHISKFDMGGFVSSEKLMCQIKESIKNISDIHLVKSEMPGQNALGLFSGKLVEIDQNTVNLIESVADSLDVVLPNDFFEMGNLRESFILTTVPFGGVSLSGSSEEKAKYEEINSLKDKIYKAMGHMQAEKIYSDLYGIELILCNNGTRFDEDIDIEIEMPEDRYIGVDEFPIPSEKLYFGNDWNFADIFEISTTKDFVGYFSSLKPSQELIQSQAKSFDLFYSKDYEKEYRETLLDIFDYQVFYNGEQVIVKIHFDYIKQHQCIAFPTWLFLKSPRDCMNAKYRITTKNNPNIIENSIDIKAYEDIEKS